VLLAHFWGMGVTRTDLFSAEENALARQLKALAHPARLAIVRQLLEAPGCVNARFVDSTGLTQPTVSRHLEVLVDAGLLHAQLAHGRVTYCIHAEGWAAFRAHLSTWSDPACDCTTSC